MQLNKDEENSFPGTIFSRISFSRIFVRIFLQSNPEVYLKDPINLQLVSETS